MTSPILPVAASLLLLLAGCDRRHDTAAEAPTVATAAEEQAPAPTGKYGITAIDAARADGAAMPADSEAPTAYDLALQAEKAPEPRAKQTPAPAAAKSLPAGVAGELLDADESVAGGG